ncbi:MAG: HAD hydrolase family protein [Bacillota bacterium]|nr:HAD hydrolase family protein [Bacillota bacterium]
MLLASDLDQTLIYSYRTIVTPEIIAQSKPVEWLDTRYISYMTHNAIRRLREISQEVLFVPVTTRTKLQYQRINFLGYGIVPQYAVTSNGGTIFFEGREDEDWAKQVLKGSVNCIAPGDLLKKFVEIAHSSWVIEDSGKWADDLFYYCLIEREKIPLSELAAFKIWASENNWELSVQGRKLYLVPRNINKKEAIQYIREKENINDVVAAGDSLLDLEMLKAAELAIAPAHGELYSLSKQSFSGLETIKFTQRSGIEAAEEILDLVQGRVSRNFDNVKVI